MRKTKRVLIFSVIACVAVACMGILSCGGDLQESEASYQSSFQESEKESFVDASSSETEFSDEEESAEDSSTSGGVCVEHSYGEWEEGEKATCFEDGFQVSKCIYCGKEIYNVLPAPMEHTFGGWEDGVQASCFEDGFQVSKCIYCGEEIYNVLPAPMEHTFSEWRTEQTPLCNVQGVYVRTCEVCGETEREVTDVDPDKHHLIGVYHYDKEAHHQICFRCQEPVGVEAHSFSEWENIKEATYQEEGEAVRNCFCGYAEQQTIAKLSQEMPTYETPTLTMAYGMPFDEALPEGFTVQENVDFLTLTVGVHTVKFSYTQPNDSEGRYQTVKDISLTITVRKRAIDFTPDFSSFAELYYTGKEVPLPSYPNAYADCVIVEWYQGDEKLAGAPVDVGSYKVVVHFQSDVYEVKQEEWTHSFTVGKQQAALDSYEIANQYYTGEEFVLTLKEDFGENVTYLWKADGVVCDTPVEIGEYTLEVWLKEGDNYEADNRAYTLQILVDDIAPVWVDGYNIYITDSTEYTFQVTDNAKIAYYAYREIGMLTWRTSVSGKVSLENGMGYFVSAYDVSGNTSSACLYVRVPTGFAPTEMYPQNNAVVTDSYTQLFAEGAKTYYLGTSPSSLFELDDSYALGLENGKQYYWMAAHGDEQSEIYSFTVQYTDVPPIQAVYPADNAVINEEYFYLGVSAPAGVATYYYRYKGASYWEKTGYGNGEPLTIMQRLNYGMEYEWYAVDKLGNQTEIRSFYYAYGESLNPEGITVYGFTDRVSYSNQTTLWIYAEAITGIRYIRYWQTGYSNYTTASLEGVDENGMAFCYMRNLKNNDRIYFSVVDGLLMWSEYYTVYVDLEAPVIGDASAEQDGGVWRIALPTVTDNLGAKQYYRVNFGEWVEYTEATVMDCLAKSVVVEVKAIDYAGNESYQRYAYGETHAPALELVSGKLDAFSNENVVVKVTPVEGGENYFWNGEELIYVGEPTEFTFSEDIQTEIYTAIRTKDGETYYGEPYTLKIDKTAPVLGGLIYRTDRYNFNSSYEYILVKENETIEENEYTIYYKLRGIDEKWKEMSLGRVPLYQYIITISGTYYVDLKAVDEAGNESEISTATILVDVEGPSVKGKVDFVYDEETGQVKTLIKMYDFVDDYGYLYHIHFLIWDQDAYDNNKEAIVNISFYTEEGTTEYLYDATHLPSGTNYYFLFYVGDNYINCSYSSLYTFYKFEAEEIFQEGDYSYSRSGTEFTVYSYRGTESSLVLPSSIRGEAYALQSRFLMQKKVVFVDVSDGITKIGEEVFKECAQLKEVIIAKTVMEIGKGFGVGSGIQAVYYEGTAEDWAKVSVGESEILSKYLYFYADSEPTEEGNYWHYDENGEIAVW